MRSKIKSPTREPNVKNARPKAQRPHRGSALLGVIATREAATAQFTRCPRQRVEEEVERMIEYHSTIDTEHAAFAAEVLATKKWS